MATQGPGTRKTYLPHTQRLDLHPSFVSGSSDKNHHCSLIQSTVVRRIEITIWKLETQGNPSDCENIFPFCTDLSISRTPLGNTHLAWADHRQGKIGQKDLSTCPSDPPHPPALHPDNSEYLAVFASFCPVIYCPKTPFRHLVFHWLLTRRSKFSPWSWVLLLKWKILSFTKVVLTL
jgi:hypothetical protein